MSNKFALILKIKSAYKKIEDLPKIAEKLSKSKQKMDWLKSSFRYFYRYAITIHTFIIQIVFYIVHNSILLTYT